MTTSLMGLLRLAHGVLGFLVTQPEERILAFTRGEATLAFVPAIPHQHEPPAASGLTPAPMSEPAPGSAVQPAPAPAVQPAPVATTGSRPMPQPGPQQHPAPGPPPSRPVPVPPPGQPPSEPGPPPSKAAASSRPAMSDEEADAIAKRLRACDTETEGLALLNRVAKNNAARQAIAKALDIAVTRSMTTDQLRTLILRHAIGARRTFAGLSSW